MFHLYFWKNKAVTMRWAGHVARVGKHRNGCSGLVGKPDGWSPLERSKHRWHNNFEIVLNCRLKGSLLDSSGPRKEPAARRCERAD
jgi:hypothetical protein